MKNKHFCGYILMIITSFLCLTMMGCKEESRFYDEKRLIESVKKIGTFDKVTLGWGASYENGSDYDFIPVTLVDGYNLPKDEEGQLQMAEIIARLVTVSLKHEAYPTYNKVMVTFEEKWGKKNVVKGKFKFDMDAL